MSSQSNARVAQLPAKFKKSDATLLLTDVRQALSIIKALGSEEAWVVFVDGYYNLCGKHIAENGGEMIKCSGDSCLAMFPESAVDRALAALLGVSKEFPRYCESHDVPVTGVKGVIHVGEIIAGEFGPNKQRDLTGKAVSTLFSLEAPGITLSEQAYRKLPSGDRGPFKKQASQVVYVMKQ